MNTTIAPSLVYANVKPFETEVEAMRAALLLFAVRGVITHTWSTQTP